MKFALNNTLPAQLIPRNQHHEPAPGGTAETVDWADSTSVDWSDGSSVDWS